MRATKEFDRFALSYSQKNFIQKRVAKRLLELLDKQIYNNILELGCGEGAIFREITSLGIKYKRYYALDISASMLSLHPNSSRLYKIEGDFNDYNLLKSLPKADIIISSSALQWSQDLQTLLKELSNLSQNGLFAIFTSATFESIFKYFDISSPIYDRDTIMRAITQNYMIEYIAIERLKLDFKSSYEMLKYIKESGVSGGRGVLSIKEIKRFLREFDEKSLEFEVIYAKVKSLHPNSY